MSGALAEALVAAQRRAMQAVVKAYVAGLLDREQAEAELIFSGATDAVDRDALLDALETIRKYGASLPAEPRPANGAPDASIGRLRASRSRRMRASCAGDAFGEPDPSAPPLDPDYLALFYGVGAP